MKTKILIVLMLLMSLVLSGCLMSYEERESLDNCHEKIAKEFCEERDCVSDSVGSYSFLIYKGEWRTEEWISFTEGEQEYCENYYANEKAITEVDEEYLVEQRKNLEKKMVLCDRLFNKFRSTESPTTDFIDSTGEEECCCIVLDNKKNYCLCVKEQ